MSEDPDFFERIRSGISVATGKQVGFSRVPENEELEGKELSLPYCVMNPIVEVFNESSMDDPHDSSDIVVQFNCCGTSPRQARWMANKIFDAMVGKTEGGDFVLPLVLGTDNLEWRLCDQRGAILPTGPNLFVEQDNYRLRRGA